MTKIFKVNMKAISLFSGGKDSFLATLIAIEQGINVVTAVGVLPADYSEMFHFQNASISGKLASSLLNLNHVYIAENNFETAIREIVTKENAEVLISGAIGSNFQKTKIEQLCTEMGIISYTPLWLLDQNLELQAVISSEIKAMIISVSAEGLSKSDLGAPIGPDLIQKLNQLHKKFRINVAGEGGEYESLVTGYLDSQVHLKRFHDETMGSMHIRMVDQIG